MADKQQLVEQFTNVTGIDADRAKFYLESASWNLEVSGIEKSTNSLLLNVFSTNVDAERICMDRVTNFRQEPINVTTVPTMLSAHLGTLYLIKQLYNISATNLNCCNKVSRTRVL
jgi:hypothetical protein